MTLTALIRKRDLLASASANPASFANETHAAEDKLAITANLALANPKRPVPSSQNKAHLTRLVEMVCRADGWEESDIAEAIRVALVDYQDALVFFTEQAQLKCIKPEPGISHITFDHRR